MILDDAIRLLWRQTILRIAIAVYTLQLVSPDAARAIDELSTITVLGESVEWNDEVNPVELRSIADDLDQWMSVDSAKLLYARPFVLNDEVTDPLGVAPYALDGSIRTDSPSLWKRLGSDQLNFYSADSIVFLGVVLASGAAMANTQADEQVQSHFQSSVRGATSDEWFEFLHANKELGNGLYSLPLMGAAWATGEVFEGVPWCDFAGHWGERSIRGFLVGAPPLVLLQRITGGSRPHETDEKSEWHPLRDNNGVSGHAFVSSLPFITAAKMSKEPWQKCIWYTASTVGPLSRINDNAHYTSQVGMGWALAFLSASAVEQSETGDRSWKLVSESPVGDSGMSLQYTW